MLLYENDQTHIIKRHIIYPTQRKRWDDMSCERKFKNRQISHCHFYYTEIKTPCIGFTLTQQKRVINVSGKTLL